MRIRDDAAVGNYRLPQCRAVNFATRQKTRMRVDRRVRLEKAIFWDEVSEVQICLVKRANRSDVLPVALEDERADMPIFDRRRDNVISEIDQIVFQRFYQHIPVENINAHRRLK